MNAIENLCALGGRRIFWDPSIRSWTLQQLDRSGNQIGEAQHTAQRHTAFAFVGRRLSLSAQRMAEQIRQADLGFITISPKDTGLPVARALADLGVAYVLDTRRRRDYANGLGLLTVIDAALATPAEKPKSLELVDLLTVKIEALAEEALILTGTSRHDEAREKRLAALRHAAHRDYGLALEFPNTQPANA